LNQAREHPLHRSRRILRVSVICLARESEAMCEPELEFELHRRAEGDREKSRELTPTASPAAFRDVAADRDRGATHLLAKTELLE
jgi:hypothetical protein